MRLLITLMSLVCVGAWAAEPISVSMGGHNVRGEVLSVDKNFVVMKVNGKEQQFLAKLMNPKDYLSCAKLVLAPKDANAHFKLGEFALQNGLKQDGKDLLLMAAGMDKATFGGKVEELLKVQEPPSPAKAVPPKPQNPVPADKTEKNTEKPSKPEPKNDGGVEFVEVTGPDGKTYRVPAQSVATKNEVDARTPAEMKKFLDERLSELNSTLGGKWKLSETKHFYFFSNIKPDLHTYFMNETEVFYNQIAMIMQHKEGDPLWNNKCPFYMMGTRAQFTTFATNFDKNPTAANSGGYFMYKGRECHIVVPMDDKKAEAHQKREATNTLYHEGTHAFLQLTGKYVTIHSWLHEGMAQFIEFFKDPKNNPGRNNHVGLLRDRVRTGNLMSWEEGKMRPSGGGDIEGYAFAWSRVQFIYNKFPKDYLPRIIREIKEGKSDEEAIEAVTKLKLADFEKTYRLWLEESAKFNFNQ